MIVELDRTVYFVLVKEDGIFVEKDKAGSAGVAISLLNKYPGRERMILRQSATVIKHYILDFKTFRDELPGDGKEITVELDGIWIVARFQHDCNSGILMDGIRTIPVKDNPDARWKPIKATVVKD